MYEELIDGLQKRGERDSVHAASYFAIEYMSKAALILLLVWILKPFSLIFAVPFVIALVFVLRGINFSDQVLHENNDQFQTLLFYMITTLAIVFLAVGWSM